VPSGKPEPTTLPNPDALASEHSQRVVQSVEQLIRENGPLPLSAYLQHVLYAPGLGYYAVGNQKLGAGGDFVTAPELTDCFGLCLARQIAQILQSVGGDILEFGAGSGTLARVLMHSAELDGFSGRYLILEPSAELKLRQQKLLETALSAEKFGRCEWLSELPSEFTGVMLANEVVDAMPVEQFNIESGALRQTFVAQTANGVELISGDPEYAVTEAVEHLQYDLRRSFSDGYQSEVSLLLRPWINAVSASMKLGVLLCIDYGYSRREYYLPERQTGTLRCYYRHHTHNDVLYYPGLQDITSDVDFTLLAEAGQSVQLDLHGFTSQGQFLLGNDLLAIADLSLVDDTRERLLAAQAVRTLTMPTGMGERFKVMALSRDLDLALDGFVGADQSHRL